MADASVHTTRGTPEGIPLQDGYSTKIALAASGGDTFSFWEKTVTPPGLDGGDPVDTTTMHNGTYRTMRARSLKTMTPVSGTCLYDPKVYTELLTIINVETTVTVHFADGSSLAFYGYLRSFVPAAAEEGTSPEAEYTIQPTNWDPTSNVEGGFDGSYNGSA